MQQPGFWSHRQLSLYSENACDMYPTRRRCGGHPRQALVEQIRNLAGASRSRPASIFIVVCLPTAVWSREAEDLAALDAQTLT